MHTNSILQVWRHGGSRLPHQPCTDQTSGAIDVELSFAWRPSTCGDAVGVAGAVMGTPAIQEGYAIPLGLVENGLGLLRPSKQIFDSCLPGSRHPSSANLQLASACLHGLCGWHLQPACRVRLSFKLCLTKGSPGNKVPLRGHRIRGRRVGTPAASCNKLAGMKGQLSDGL